MFKTPPTRKQLTDEVKRLRREVETLKSAMTEGEGSEAGFGFREVIRLLADHLPYPVVVSSPEGALEYASPRFSQIFGYTLEELSNRKRLWRATAASSRLAIRISKF